MILIPYRNLVDNFVWLGYQSGPNERKVDIWAFGHSKQSIILRNPFLDIYIYIYIGGDRPEPRRGDQGIPVRPTQHFFHFFLVIASFKYLGRIKAYFSPLKCV